MASLEIIESYRRRAEEDVKAAREMLASRFHLAAVSRAYYAIFYAATATLLMEDIAVHSHKQLAIEFRRYFIKTKKMDSKYSQIFEELFQARQTVDYDAIPEITPERVQELIDEAGDFVNTLKNLTGH